MVSVSAESPPRFLQCLLRFCHLPLLTPSPPLRLLATCPVLLSPKSFNVTPVSHQFSLISGFVKWLLSKTEVQLLILGIDHAGKTKSAADGAEGANADAEEAVAVAAATKVALGSAEGGRSADSVLSSLDHLGLGWD